MSKQEPWEEALEDALAVATPAEVLTILRKIKGWLVGLSMTLSRPTYKQQSRNQRDENRRSKKANSRTTRRNGGSS
jgi:hypothetical protein